MTSDDTTWRAAVDRALAPLHRAVAHDLRSPLNAIALNLALVRRTLDDQAASARRWLDVVESESRRLAGLLEAYLELTALPAAPLDLRPGDLGALLGAAEPVLCSMAKRRGVELTLDPAPARGTWPEGVARRAMVASVALAIASTGAGGVVRARSEEAGGTARLVLSGDCPPDRAEVERLVAPLGGRVVATAEGLSVAVPGQEAAA